MILSSKVLSEIISATEGIDYEIGGILGSNDTNTVNYIYFDNIREPNKFNYCPNTDILNNIISKWASCEIQFEGIFHTHFYGVETLSEYDIKYINQIMYSLQDIITCLYFPIFVLPQNELIIYKAINEQKHITILRENLYII